MANLNTYEREILEKLFQMSSGYVLNFSDRTIGDFFRDDLGISFFSEEYNQGSGSKANRMRGFWSRANNLIVGTSILKLVEYIDQQVLLEKLSAKDFPEALKSRAKEIGKRLQEPYKNVSQASFSDGEIRIILRKEIFDHVKRLLDNGHYFNAVEEAYKIVRMKLEGVSGKERATDAFSASNFEKIFGRQPIDQREKDFIDGVKYLHMAIQFLRNEKAHTPASDLDKNLAVHYIALASLAYDLIDRQLS